MQLQDSETLLLELYPNRSVLKLWFFTKCIPAALISAFLAFWALSFFGGVIFQSNFGFEYGVLFAIPAAIIVLVVATIYIHYLRKSYIYTVTNKRVNFQGGILRYADRSIQYERITNVEKSQNLFERILGLESIWLHTAGYSGANRKAEIVFEGLKDVSHALTTINKMKQDQAAST